MARKRIKDKNPPFAYILCVIIVRKEPNCIFKATTKENKKFSRGCQPSHTSRRPSLPIIPTMSSSRSSSSSSSSRQPQQQPRQQHQPVTPSTPFTPTTSSPAAASSSSVSPSDSSPQRERELRGTYYARPLNNRRIIAVEEEEEKEEPPGDAASWIESLLSGLQVADNNFERNVSKASAQWGIEFVAHLKLNGLTVRVGLLRSSAFSFSFFSILSTPLNTPGHRYGRREED